MKPHSECSPETLAVHAGIENIPFHAVVPPIYQTSTFGFDSAAHGASLFAGKGEGYIYTRMGNPTVEAFENAVAALEGGYRGLACGSGMAAIHTAIASLVKAGDHIVCSEAVYGPTCTLIHSIMTQFGVDSSTVDTSDLAEVKQAFRPNTKLVFVETPANPTLVISDLPAIAKLAHEHGAVLVVDNTFMSPMLQQPLALGTDIVVHSLTKFLNGHADVIGGIIVTRTEEHYACIRRMLNHFGGVLSPLESFLVHRGMRTLALRMERHCTNAQKIAEWLEARSDVEWVRFPGLRSHPQYALAQKQMRGPGAMISFCLKGGLEAGRQLMDNITLWTLAVSLGGVESLIQHPASMTHASMGTEARRQAHIDDGLVRLSVGVEHVDDLIAALDDALAVASGGTRCTVSIPEPAAS